MTEADIDAHLDALGPAAMVWHKVNHKGNGHFHYEVCVHCGYCQLLFAHPTGIGLSVAATPIQFGHGCPQCDYCLKDQ